MPLWLEQRESLVTTLLSASPNWAKFLKEANNFDLAVFVGMSAIELYHIVWKSKLQVFTHTLTQRQQTRIQVVLFIDREPAQGF